MSKMNVLSRIKPLHIWISSLIIIIGAGLVAGVIVFTKGLSVTNLTDLVPWGLWITIDLSAIGLSAGAFLLSAAVHLLGLKQFKPVARTAVFVGLIGYSIALCTLLLDIGRPDRFWHALVFWNPHSVLWEVSMCIALYFSVLLVETIPMFGQAEWLRSRWPRLAALLQKVHKVAPVMAVVGLGLSMLHQSSLGATFGVIKARPVWYRPGLSVLFIVSAMAGGVSLTILASMLASRLSKLAQVKDELLERLAHFVGWVLVGYLYFRFWDAFAMSYTYEPARTEGLKLLSQGSLSFNFWFGEMILGAVVPIILLLNTRFRRNPTIRMVALIMVVGGLVAYRWDTTMAGLLIVPSYLPQEVFTGYTSYIPSLIEFVSGAGLIAYGLLAFTLGVRYLNIVNHHEDPSQTAIPEAQPEPELAPALGD